MFDDQSIQPAAATAPAPATSRAVVQPRSTIVLSGPMRIDLSIYRGDTGLFRITVRDPSGNPIDVSGATWDGDIRAKATDVDALASFDITPVVGDTASVDVALTAASSEKLTGTCVYDIEMRLGTDVTTLIYGNVAVTQDVSRP